MTRADPIRTALERLIAALGDYEPIWGGFPESALAAARAALAGQQGEGPSDEELTQFLFDNFRGPIEFICDAEEVAHVMIRNHIKFARAVLARWGHQPAPLVAGATGPSMEDVGPLIAWLTEQACQAANASQPADAGMLTWAAQVIGERVNEDVPVAGEVAELVAWIHQQAVHGPDAAEWRRAAELLQRQHPTPVPVSERLPGDQLCWWYEPDEDDGYGGRWTLLRIRGGTGTYSHWLPAHALPLPSGEVES